MSRQGIMLATPFEQNRLLRWGSKAIVQPKLNGERCRAYIDENGRCRLRSSENNEIISVPHINKKLETLSLRSVELDGELYSHGMDFDDIHSIVGRKVNIHQGYEIMELHLFDLITDKPQLERLQMLYYLLPKELDTIKRVTSIEISSMSDMENAYETFMESGYEGIILRHPTAPYERKRVTTMMKHKPRERDEFTILDVEEEIDKNGKPKGRAGALKLQGELGSFWAAGMNDEEKDFFWKHKDFIKGRIALIEYQYLTSKLAKPRHPVFIKVV